MNERVAQPLRRHCAVCVNCGKGHKGVCLLGQGRCFYYYQPGHEARDFPKKKDKKAKVQTSTSQGDYRP
ncbi:hypothetical protein SESBI_46961 [Sesbania bispinosa]|nr:hypothetical protein SESBI_46961 [Sesbania bispinosa]